MTQNSENQKKEREKKEKQKKEKLISQLMGKRFLTIEAMAKLANRKPEEIEAYIESGAIQPNCYCYPAASEFPVGEGAGIAFFPKPTLAAIKAAKQNSK